MVQLGSFALCSVFVGDSEASATAARDWLDAGFGAGLFRCSARIVWDKRPHRRGLCRYVKAAETTGSSRVEGLFSEGREKRERKLWKMKWADCCG